MPLVTKVITTESKNAPVDTIRTLHTELTAVGLPVIGTDGSDATKSGAATSDDVKLFQDRYHLPVTGEFDSTTGGVRSLAALVATEPDRTKLQTELANMVNNVPDSPQYNYWLARYAVMTGDYALAKKVSSSLVDLSGKDIDLGNILTSGTGTSPGSPQQPEVPHPENFYSYREDLVDQDQLAQLEAELASLTVEQYAAYISTPGNTVDPNTINSAWFNAIVRKARPALAAIAAWQTGNHYAANREITLALQSYQECQSLVADYFQTDDSPLLGDTGDQRLQALLARRRDQNTPDNAFWTALRWRRILLSLQELEDNDRKNAIGNDGAFTSAAAFVTTFTAVDEFGSNTAAQNQAQRLDPLMIVIGTVWVPLAIGELNSQLRQFEAAIEGFAEILNAQATVDVSYRYLCEFIEVPFIRLLTLKALLDKADAEYKAGTTVDDATLPDADPGLLAAQTYQQVLSKIAEDGQYAANITQGRDQLVTSIGQATGAAFRSLGKGITVPTISTIGNALPGLDRALAPHQQMTIISAPDGRTTNPTVYAIGLLATAKLEQIKAGFNYLGYPSDYVPPWRFSFLLDQARYFAEHAKNAQRDYLNFLNNAENEEFQEQSLAQNVEMEKMNVNIETSKVDMVSTELAAARAAADVATLQAQDAQERADEYLSLELQQDEADFWSGLGSMFGSVVEIGEGAISGNPVNVVEGTLGLVSGGQQGSAKQAEREFEQSNYQRSANEAKAAAAEAAKRVIVAQASLVVAGLELQAAVLRHEFAVENLNYVRNRTLNADQWFRLANAIRSVSDTYLKDAIELAFLAQQAYEFESNRVIDVIRFDYDLSDVGAMLAADFLLRDLDSLEQDLIVSQQTRIQEVRYVLSMAREFPETLRALAETGKVMFSVRLEQLERHFPGLLNLRISSVDVQPVALMDPTRVSMELTQTGAGMVRLKAQPGVSALNSSDLAAEDDWLGAENGDWPVKIHVSSAETAVFTGLSRQEATSLSLITASERGAFEGLPGASSWSIDMSMKENEVIPDTLSDVVFTFVLSGYHDPELKDAVTVAASSSRTLATTSFISARQVLPDAYYSLVHYGRLDWDISDRMLSVADTPNELRNLALMFPLLPGGPEHGRCYCHYPIQIQVASGTVEVLTALPQFTLTLNSLTVEGTFTGPASTEVTWDFGDGTALTSGPSVQHTFARPGRYEIVTRLVKEQHLFEYRSAAVVSANNAVVSPLIVAPVLSASAVGADGTVAVTITTPDLAEVSLDCSAGAVRGRANSGSLTLNLAPGSYVLDFVATRKLSARFYSKQRYLPTETVELYRGRISTNRTFDLASGAENTTSPNAFSTLLFESGNAVISPVDRWTLELPLADNPWFTSVSSSDIAEFDGGELADAILSLEFLSRQ
jgi:hypothetical protein